MAEEAQSNKSPALKVSTIVSAIFATLFIFVVFAAISGCWQSIDWGTALRAGTGSETAASATRNACALGFMSFGIGVAGWFLGLAGTLFDYTLLAFVVSMGSLVGQNAPFANGIQLGWTIIRDLVNLAFIGGLIYAAISLILKLGTQNIGQLVVRIIVAALLVNFSYFFGAVIIDASNFVSQKIYDEAIYSGDRVTGSQLDPRGINPFSFSSVQESAQVFAATAPVSERFMIVTRLGSLYDLRTEDFEVGGEFSDNSLAPYILSGMGFFLFTITASVFATAAVFLFIRFAIIILLLITAPVGILYFIGVPPFTNWGKAWWDTLIAQSLFPVVFLILVGISFKVMELGFVSSVAGDKSLFNLVTNPDSLEVWYANLNLLMVFGVAWFFLYFSLQAASNIAQQKQFTPPTPAGLFAGASGFGKFVTQLYPRTLAFRAATAVTKPAGEWAVDRGAALGRVGGRALGGLGAFVTAKPLRDSVGLKLSPAARARRDVEARRTARVEGHLNDAMGTDAEAASKGRKGLKEEFDRMSAEERAQRWNGMNARQRAAVEDSLPADMVAKIREDAKKGGKIDAAAKEARTTSVAPGTGGTQTLDVQPVVRAIAASDSHEAVRDNRELYRQLMNARKDQRAMETLIDEMRSLGISLSKLPTDILTSEHVRAQLTVKDLDEIYVDPKRSYEEYRKVRRRAPKQVVMEHDASPGRFGRPVPAPEDEEDVPQEESEAPNS